MTNVEVDIEALAKLARLEIRAEELASLAKEIPDILSFVETIQGVRTGKEGDAAALRNVLRKDDDPHESGIYTEKLLEAAPTRQGNRIAVKQVLSRAEIFRERSDHENPSVVSKKATNKRS